MAAGAGKVRRDADLHLMAQYDPPGLAPESYAMPSKSACATANARVFFT